MARSRRAPLRGAFCAVGECDRKHYAAPLRRSKRCECAAAQHDDANAAVAAPRGARARAARRGACDILPRGSAARVCSGGSICYIWRGGGEAQKVLYAERAFSTARSDMARCFRPRRAAQRQRTGEEARRYARARQDIFFSALIQRSSAARALRATAARAQQRAGGVARAPQRVRALCTQRLPCCARARAYARAPRARTHARARKARDMQDSAFIFPLMPRARSARNISAAFMIFLNIIIILIILYARARRHDKQAGRAARGAAACAARDNVRRARLLTPRVARWIARGGAARAKITRERAARFSRRALRRRCARPRGNARAAARAKNGAQAMLRGARACGARCRELMRERARRCRLQRCLCLIARRTRRGGGVALTRSARSR